MHALVVYESMFGNTRAIAEAVGAGLAESCSVTVTAVGRLRPEDLDGLTLLVVGGPTHVWGMSRPKTRAAAAAKTQEAGSTLTLEQGATGIGLREWLETLPVRHPKAAAFDTRLAQPGLLTGHASNKIAALLRHRGCRVIMKPQSFLVTGKTQLLPGESERAREWGVQLGHL